MSPEEKSLLESTYKLSEENNILLNKIRAAQRRSTIYGFIRLAVLVLPLIVGYLFIQPFLGNLGNPSSNFQEIQDLLNN